MIPHTAAQPTHGTVYRRPVQMAIDAILDAIGLQNIGKTRFIIGARWIVHHHSDRSTGILEPRVFSDISKRKRSRL